MPIKLEATELENLIHNFRYSNFGDNNERTFGSAITERFPNSEFYWQRFVTPMTNRIDSTVTHDKIGARKTVSIDIQELSRLNYSVFMNLVYANQCLHDKQLSYFENFYAHLGTVCDLSEEFITQLYIITLECEGLKTEVLQELSKEGFLKIAEKWYDDYYASSFEHYLKKGKTAPFKIIGRSNLLDEYFSNAKEWKEYKKFAQQIRTYRNVIVHNAIVGGRIVGTDIYVPRIKNILKYKQWHQIFSITRPEVEKDFIERNTQMRENFITMNEKLNLLWQKPIEHFNRLLYIDRKPLLMQKYDLVLS